MPASLKLIDARRKVLNVAVKDLTGIKMYVRAAIKVCNEEKTFDDVALADTGATGIIVDESVAEELGIKTFGEAKIVTLGTVVKCSFADVSNVVIEDTEIGPRRLFVCRFPEEVKGRLKLMGFSEKIILGVSAIEDAGYIPNTDKGVLEKVGFFAL